jgi:hypothetical protein
MATAMAWLDCKDEVAAPEFFENAVAVELPELSWRDAESATGELETNVEQQAEPEPQTADPAKEAAERERRITNAERCFDKTKHDSRLRWYKAQDRRMDTELASGKIQYFDRHRIAFFKVVEQFITFKNRSTLKVQQYEADKGKPTLKPATPNRVDFLVDVENVGKKALKDSPVLALMFLREAIQNELENWQSVPADMRTQIEHRVGWWFIRAGLHPSDRYWA